MTTWTHSDIESLTIFYTTGLSIKEIAKKMGRSPTALHKAISRFKLHPIRGPYFKKDSSSGNVAENGLPIVPKNQRSHPSYLKELFQKYFNEEWVSFEEVLAYLKEKQVVIDKINNTNDLHEQMYAFKNKIFVASQVLLIANKLRVEEKKTPFKVESMSW
ncbi:MAG: hypothetical protein KBD31_00705 [Proteobacteria bacterium]|nr:hypothetical protein [Pseudomonadota bacterium]